MNVYKSKFCKNTRNNTSNQLSLASRHSRTTCVDMIFDRLTLPCSSEPWAVRRSGKISMMSAKMYFMMRRL